MDLIYLIELAEIKKNFIFVKIRKKQLENPWKGLAKLPRELWILSITALINRSGSMVLPFLAIYANKHLNLSFADSGLLLSAYGIAALITAPVFGRICDWINPEKVMKFSLLFSGLLLFAFPYAKSFQSLLILTFVWSILNEAFRPANLVLISSFSSLEQRRMAFALNRLAINLGMSIGPALGGFLVMYNYNSLFYVDAASHLLAFIFLLTYSSKMAVEKGKKSSGEPVAMESDKSRKRTIFLFLIAFLPIVMVFFQMMSTFPLFLTQELKYPESIYGLCFTLNTVLIILIEVPLMNYLAMHSNIKLIRWGALLVGIGFGATIFAHSLPVLFATVVVWTFGEMIVFPASAAYVSEIAMPERRGAYMGYYQTANNLAFSVGPWIGTIVYGAFGSIVLWGAAFGLGIASYLMLRLVKEDKPAL